MSDNEEFVASVEKATFEMIMGMVANMKTATLMVERDAKKNCNVDQGITRAAMFSEVSFDSKEIVGTVGNNQDNAPYLEKGTGIYAKDGNGRKTPWSWGNKGSKKWPGRKGFRGARPHPFLEPARDSNKDKVVNILAGKKI